LALFAHRLLFKEIKMWEEGEFTANMRKHHEEYLRRSESENRNNYSGGGSRGVVSGGGGILGLIAFAFIWTWIIEFLEKNWISVVSILGIIVVCVIVCIIVGKKVYRSGLPLFLTILISGGLIFGVIYFGMMQYDGNFERFRKTVASSTSSNADFAYVNTDVLNFRKGPDASYDIIKGISKDVRVQIIDKSGIWWKIKVDGIEGYVNSEYLRLSTLLP
jgi:hypothetical protein